MQLTSNMVAGLRSRRRVLGKAEAVLQLYGVYIARDEAILIKGPC